MRPRRHLTIDQQYLAIARLQTGCSQREVATELRVSQSVISRLQQRYRETGRVTERHRSGRPLATSHTDDRFIVNSALRNRMMNATQLQAHLRENDGRNDVGDVKESAMHQPLLSPDDPLVVAVVTVWADLNPIENLWDQLTHRVEARNSVPQNLNDLRAALQEEWDAMPQQTISRLIEQHETSLSSCN
ncbi:hypothetical protein SKAU_G00240930 [Synaphobranchus kaupii]|uniref:HTH cro/C1-type domain-containing protein n=1 Tax=Synaphobranchus kaupii TaxID=118154 RepID=A0A9Q1ITW2_SYNKA|nr:hypothetical protein SKAU_G00240930 [Synaphobranchus kaupii]